jgi:hypothetical protein
MAMWRRPKQWKKLVHVELRSPEWLAVRYRKTFVRAAEYAKSRSPTFGEPMRGLLSSLRYEELSPIFRTAVISVEAHPFKGGLHQTYSWGHIASVGWKQLGEEIVEHLEDFLRYTRRKEAREALTQLRDSKRAAATMGTLEGQT